MRRALGRSPECAENIAVQLRLGRWFFGAEPEKIILVKGSAALAARSPTAASRLSRAWCWSLPHDRLPLKCERPGHRPGPLTANWSSTLPDDQLRGDFARGRAGFLAVRFLAFALRGVAAAMWVSSATRCKSAHAQRIMVESLVQRSHGRRFGRDDDQVEAWCVELEFRQRIRERVPTSTQRCDRSKPILKRVAPSSLFAWCFVSSQSSLRRNATGFRNSASRGCR